MARSDTKCWPLALALLRLHHHVATGSLPTESLEVPRDNAMDCLGPGENVVINMLIYMSSWPTGPDL